MPSAVSGPGAHRYRLSGTPLQGFALATWGFFAGFAAVALYGPVAVLFQDPMRLTGVSLGFLVAAPQITGSLFRIPFGAWVDRAGGRVPMLTLLGLSLIGVWGLVFLLATTTAIDSRLYPVMLFFGLLSGCGVASFSVGIPQVSYWYPRSRQGAILGIYSGIGNLAPGLFTLLLPVAIETWGAMGSYLGWLLFLVVAASIYALFAHDAYYFQLRAQGVGADESREIAARHGEGLFPKESAWPALMAAAENPRTWGLMVLYFVSFGGFLALTVWFPVFWVNSYHVSMVQAGLLGGVGFSLLAAVIRVYGSALSERLGAERVAVLAYSVVLAGALLLTLGRSFYLSLAGEMLVALGMGTGNATVFRMVPRYVPEAVEGASWFVGGIGATGGFMLPPFLGAVVDALGRRGYAGGFFAYVVLAVIALIVSGGFRRIERRRSGPAGGQHR